MKFKEPRCPQCGDEGNVNSEKKCEKCGEQLVYADGEGTMKIAEKQRHCPRCNTVNSKEVRFCENCGTEIGKFCGYCNMYHFIEDKVCPKTGEPIRGGGKEQAAVGALPKIFTAASIIALLFFGFLAFKYSHKPTPPVVVQTPVYVVVQTPVPITPVTKPKIDVVFVVDNTGSMGDEIEVVKAKVKELVSTIASGQPKPEVRYGIVAFRDRGDAYVTRKFDFTDSLNNLTEYVNQMQADGGGDTEESVNEALHVAINDMTWDASANTKKMIFVVGDAGPHTDYPGDYNYRNECATAKNKGIKIFTIGCSGIENSGEREFREIAQLTNGEFDYLTYQQVYTRQDGSEMKVVTAGKKAYVCEPSVDDREWRDEGASGLLSKGRAKEVDASAVCAPSAPGAAPAASVASEKRNNLDSMFTRRIQNEAEGLGVKYEKK